jgi:hypothetical protein
MATYSEATIQQGTYEIRKWTVDFTNDLPTGGTVSSGTAYHTPPSGTAATLTIAATNPYVTVQLGTLSVTGVHYLDVVATLSNGETSQVRIAFPVNYPAVIARAGMATLVSSLRNYGVMGVNDYTIAGVPYWSDAQVQTVLDKHKVFVNSEQLQPIETMNNGTVLYTEYRSQFGNFEETTGGTTIFVIKNSTGSVFGTSNWSADYANGIITFTANTAGTPYYLTGTSYDVYGAAADVWRMKSGHHAQSLDFTTDNMSVKRGQLMKNDMEMANYYAGMGRVKHMSFERDDTT